MDSSFSNHWSVVDHVFHDVNGLLRKSTSTMPPRRITRRSVASPSPSLSDVAIGATPKVGKRGKQGAVEQVRNQTPTRFSLSYGSSLVAQLDRNKTAAGIDLETTFAQIGETVRTDNIKAEARRRELEARMGSTTPGPRRPDPIQEETEEEQEQEEEEEKEHYDDYDEEEEERLEQERAEEMARQAREKAERDAAERERKRLEKERKEQERKEKERKEKEEREEAERAAKEKAEKEKKEKAAKAAKAKVAREARERAEQEARKRAREEEEEEQAELERIEREDRRRRERAEEAQRQADLKHAAEAARKQEEQRQAREAMRPPPLPPKPLLSTPPKSRTRELVPPDTGNSYVEESDVYTDSEKRREELEEERRQAEQQMRLARLAAQYTPEPPEPPRIARRPASTLSPLSSHFAQDQADQPQTYRGTETEPMVSDKQYPSFSKSPKPATRPSRPSRPQSDEQSNTTNGETPPPPYTTAPTFVQRSLSVARRSLWVMWKVLTYLLPVLLLVLFVLSASSSDSGGGIRWYGWKHWRSNVGQFIPSHPQLTDDQFEDLKHYILEQSSSTESAVKNIQTLLPRMVHVKRGPNGDLIIQDDFWHALLDKMLKDSSVLTLDGTGDISEEHWDALRLRLIKAGIFEKGPSDEHIEHVAEGTVSKTWERWVAKNGEKVAQIVREHLPGGDDKGDGMTRDAVISRDEFSRLLTKRIAEHKEEIDDRLATVKKGLETLIDKTVKEAISNSEGSLSKSDITNLVRNIVQKEIPRAQLEAAAKDGIMRNYYDYIEGQINHFGLGNEAGIVLTESSPVYNSYESQALPGNKHLNKLFGSAKPISGKDKVALEQEYMLALSAWNDVGQCWCAGITASRGAELAVEMAQMIIPQAIVVENVHPNATTDRGSMPKDIEIWGYYPQLDDNKRLLAWMDELYPGEREVDLKRVDEKGKSLSLINKKYVKIGELEYDYAKTSGSHGMFVHKLSEELLDLDAATYKVLVRAKTNHGAQDHTCFYRLQLFGEELEFEDDHKDL